MRCEFISYIPKRLKGIKECFFCINLIPQIQFCGFVNCELTIGWLFWEFRVRGKE